MKSRRTNVNCYVISEIVCSVRVIGTLVYTGMIRAKTEQTAGEREGGREGRCSNFI